MAPFTSAECRQIAHQISRRSRFQGIADSPGIKSARRDKDRIARRRTTKRDFGSGVISNNANVPRDASHGNGESDRVDLRVHNLSRASRQRHPRAAIERGSIPRSAPDSNLTSTRLHGRAVPRTESSRERNLTAARPMTARMRRFYNLSFSRARQRLRTATSRRSPSSSPFSSFEFCFRISFRITGEGRGMTRNVREIVEEFQVHG